MVFPVLLDYQKPNQADLEELLTILNLRERRGYLPSQLSGGQQQRVAIGRALITRPSLILADEPTGNLDTKNSSEVIALLKEASRKYEQTILMITHSKSFAAEVERQPCVERAFGRMYKSLPAIYEGKTGRIDLISYEERQFQWAEPDLVSGSMEAVREGDGVLTVFDKSNTLQAGDVIQLDSTSLTVAGVLEDSPFDTSDQPTVICSEALFTAITGEDAYAILDVQLTKDATQQDVRSLQTLADGEYVFYDRLAQNQDTQNTYFMFCLFVYGFLVVITLITIIHTANSIAMSVSARTRQYGAMRAVGMDEGQIQRMITAESAVYTLLGLLAGCGLGLPLHYFLYSQMITSYWGTAWHLPLSSAGGILVLLVCTALLIPLSPSKRICRMAVSETINEL